MVRQLTRSLHFKCIETVHEAIQAMDLDGLDGHLYRRQLPVDRDLELPAVIVSPQGTELLPPGTFEDTDVGYPVTVWFLSAKNQDLEIGEQELMWREQVIDRFMDLPLGIKGEALAWDAQVEPGSIVSESLWREHNLLGGYVVLRVQTRKDRGRA